MALFSMFLGCFLDSSPQVAVEGDDKTASAAAYSLDISENNCESKSHSDQDFSSGDVEKEINNKSKGSQILVSYFPTGSRLSYL
ncbi:hypothetical protein DCAR_0104517 [Daucus carota subsp. sativus]|uniref:Uncharacterized protein n=1 Tax=Daucus carota subsp. sativus TaxID=79200 RepID=A0A166IWJ4_DAUCS|nr:hypothetical protein DCAR_0104517 [Daucus carota subsp. sativus]